MPDKDKFTDDQFDAYVDCLNSVLEAVATENDSIKELLPVKPGVDSFLSQIDNGVLLCEFINSTKTNIIDKKKIHTKPKNKMHKIENLNSVIKAAKDLGCQVVNISAEDFVDRKPLVLGLCQQIVKYVVVSSANIGYCPQLILLLDKNETIFEMAKVKPMELLARWANYHLLKGGYSMVHKIDAGLKDGIAVSQILSLLFQEIELSDLEAVGSSKERWTMIIEILSMNISLPCFITVLDLDKGNLLSIACVLACVFREKHGLKFLFEEDVNHLHETISELTKNMISLQEQHTEAVELLDNKQNELDESYNKINELYTEGSKMKILQEQYDQLKCQTTTQLQETKNKLEESAKTMNVLKEQYDETKHSLDETTQELDKKEKQLEETVHKLDENSNNKCELDENISNMRERLNQSDKKAEESNERFIQQELKTIEVEQKFRAYRATAQAVKNNAKIQGAEIDRLRKENSSTKESLTMYQNLTKEKDRELEELRILAEEAHVLREEKEESEAIIEKLRVEIDNNMSKANNQTQNEELADVRASLARTVARAEDYQRKLAASQHSNGELQRQLKEETEQRDEDQRQYLEKLKQKQGAESNSEEEKQQQRQYPLPQQPLPQPPGTPMVQRKVNSYRRQLRSFYKHHSKETRKLSQILFQHDISVTTLESIPAQKSGANVRHMVNAKETKVQFYFVLVENFLFIYKIGKKETPVDIIRLDGYEIQRMTIPHQYILNLCPTEKKDEKGKGEKLDTVTIECKSEAEQYEWYYSFLHASSWWIDAAEDMTANRLELERRSTVAHQIKFKTLSMEEAKAKGRNFGNYDSRMSMMSLAGTLNNNNADCESTPTTGSNLNPNT